MKDNNAHGADSRPEVRRRLRLGTLLLKLTKTKSPATTGTGSSRMFGLLERQLTTYKRLSLDEKNLNQAGRRLERIMVRVMVQMMKNQRNHT